MPHTLYLVPSGIGVGLTTLALGLVRALDNRGVRVAFFKPIGQPLARDTGPERSTYFVRRTSSLTPATPIAFEEAQRLLLHRKSDELLDQVLRNFHASAGDADVVVVEGLIDTHEAAGEAELNRELVRTLSAEVILAGALGSQSITEFEAQLEFTASQYGGFGAGHVIGCLVNRVPARDGKVRASLYPEAGTPPELLTKPEFNVIGAIPENPELMACAPSTSRAISRPRSCTRAKSPTRRARKITLLARTVPNLLDSLVAGSILITPGDRADVVCASRSQPPTRCRFRALILTGDIDLPKGILDLCHAALATGLPS
jgi:phosphate acetyltransferase